MSEDAEQKKPPRATASTTKSYTPDGATTEFDPGAFQVHAISPELRRKMHEGDLPQLAPEYYQDTAPPNQHLASTAETPGPGGAPGLGGSTAGRPPTLDNAAETHPVMQPTNPRLRRAVDSRLRSRRAHAMGLALLGGLVCGLAFLWLISRPTQPVDTALPSVGAARTASRIAPQAPPTIVRAPAVEAAMKNASSAPSAVARPYESRAVPVPSSAVRSSPAPANTSLRRTADPAPAAGAKPHGEAGAELERNAAPTSPPSDTRSERTSPPRPNAASPEDILFPIQ